MEFIYNTCVYNFIKSVENRYRFRYIKVSLGKRKQYSIVLFTIFPSEISYNC